MVKECDKPRKSGKLIEWFKQEGVMIKSAVLIYNLYISKKMTNLCLEVKVGFYKNSLKLI